MLLFDLYANALAYKFLFRVLWDEKPFFDSFGFMQIHAVWFVSLPKKKKKKREIEKCVGSCLFASFFFGGTMTITQFAISLS